MDAGTSSTCCSRFWALTTIVLRFTTFDDADWPTDAPPVFDLSGGCALALLSVCCAWSTHGVPNRAI